MLISIDSGGHVQDSWQFININTVTQVIATRILRVALEETLKMLVDAMDLLYLPRHELADENGLARNTAVAEVIFRKVYIP